jgi:hypothetical protein
MPNVLKVTLHNFQCKSIFHILIDVVGRHILDYVTQMPYFMVWYGFVYDLNCNING